MKLKKVDKEYLPLNSKSRENHESKDLFNKPSQKKKKIEEIEWQVSEI